MVEDDTLSRIVNFRKTFTRICMVEDGTTVLGDGTHYFLLYLLTRKLSSRS